MRKINVKTYVVYRYTYATQESYETILNAALYSGWEVILEEPSGFAVLIKREFVE